MTSEQKLVLVVSLMPISRDRKRELRKAALSVIWQSIDTIMHQSAVMFDPLEGEELSYLTDYLDKRSQNIFNEWADLRDRKENQD